MKSGEYINKLKMVKFKKKIFLLKTCKVSIEFSKFVAKS